MSHRSARCFPCWGKCTHQRPGISGDPYTWHPGIHEDWVHAEFIRSLSLLSCVRLGTSEFFGQTRTSCKYIFMKRSYATFCASTKSDSPVGNLSLQTAINSTKLCTRQTSSHHREVDEEGEEACHGFLQYQLFSVVITWTPYIAVLKLLHILLNGKASVQASNMKATHPFAS